jgi:hypothetical protein
MSTLKARLVLPGEKPKSGFDNEPDHIFVPAAAAKYSGVTYFKLSFVCKYAPASSSRRTT